jgi:hypothetical protein
LSPLFGSAPRKKLMINPNLKGSGLLAHILNVGSVQMVVKRRPSG